MISLLGTSTTPLADRVAKCLAHAWSSARTTGERSIRTWSCFSLSACAPPPAPAGQPSPQWSKRRRRDPRSSHVGMHNQRAIYMWSCFSLSACVHRRPSSRSKRCTRCPGRNMQRFVRYGACWTCYHLLSTDLLAERKVVVASSMK
jgi:hypothetical protein